MKNIQWFKVLLLCSFLIFTVYIIKYPKEYLVSYDELDTVENMAIKSEKVQAPDKKMTKNLKRELLNKTALPTKSLKNLLKCKDKDDSFTILQHGKFWLLKNYAKALKYVQCHETISYTTHCDFTFLDNVVPLLERWFAPLQVAVYAAGDDFQAAKTAILYLRNCHPQKSLVRKFATFHIFFESQFLPENFHRDFNKFEKDFHCKSSNQINDFPIEKTFKAKNNLTYPVNVARNLAREAALTHFVLASDIELYPSLGIVDNFFKMLQRNPEVLAGNNVFVLPIFEVEKDQKIPNNKTELLHGFHKNDTVWFHFKICPTCHTVPNASDWMNLPDENDMKIFISTKRVGSFNHWEPIFIGTNKEPFYDERLNWEGKSDKMTQAYILCLLNYNFNILSNAFLVHKPGIKEVKEAARWNLEKVNKEMIINEIMPEIKLFYGSKDGCKIY